MRAMRRRHWYWNAPSGPCGRGWAGDVWSWHISSQSIKYMVRNAY